MSNDDHNSGAEAAKAGGASVAGAVAGASVATTVVGMGLTVEGTALSIRAAPVIVAGAVIGLAG